MIADCDFAALFSLSSPANLPPPQVPPTLHASSLAFLESIHHHKSEALKLFIAEQGWPTSHGTSDPMETRAFIIAHHSDYDLDFQKLCHMLMLTLVKQGYRHNLGFLAFLTDRILCNMGKHQRFGTQVREVANGCFVPKAIEDVDKVDELRTQVGIPETMFDYMQRINEGDVVLYRSLIDDTLVDMPASPDGNVIPFPKH